MFDLSWSEILLIAVVAIVVIGPKELPTFLRLLGRWTAKARGMAREFQGHVDDMVREAELEEVRQQVEKAGSDITRDIEKTVDPKGEVSSALSAPELTGSPLDPSTPPSAEIAPPPAVEVPAPAPQPEAAPAAETPAPQKPAA